MKIRALKIGTLVCLLTGLIVVGSSAVVQQYSELWGVNGEIWTPQSRLPDFSFAGYHSGNAPIPTVPVVANVRDYGAVGNGTTDDTQAFRNAIAAVSSGAISIPAGRYKITQPLQINKSNVVLRGAGAGSTTLYFPNSLRDMLGPAPEWAGGNGFWSWGGGVIWVAGSDSDTAVKLSDVTAPALRGDRQLTLSSAASISVGSTIRLVQIDPSDDSLGRHLHADYFNAGQGPTIAAAGRFVDWAVKVTAKSGNTITLERPLRQDVRMAWQPQILSYVQSVKEVGLEEFTIEFPNTQYNGHFTETGYNGIYFHNVHDSWVRNVTIVDADSGFLTNPPVFSPFITSRFCTIQGLRLMNRWRTTGITGHHGVALEGPNDFLITNFSFDTKFLHDFTLDANANGNVFSAGRGVDLNFDHHTGLPYENLFTQIDAGVGSRLWDSGGPSDGGPHAGARETFWNILAPSAPSLPSDWPQMTIVGMTRYSTTRSDYLWIENIDPNVLAPSNLYLAQLARRVGNQPPSVASGAGASPNPVTGGTTAVGNVLGADDNGEQNLTYSWAPGPALTFNPNNSNAAKDTTATFSAAGGYTLTATITDSGGLSTTSNVNVTVAQTMTTINVLPGSASVAMGNTQQFTATARDQFGANMASQPTFTWSTNGGGTIDSTGRFTGTTAGGPFTVTAQSGSVSGSASVTVNSSGLPTVTIVATDTSLSEPGTDRGTFTATRTGSTASSLTVDFTVTGTATSGNDYATLGTSVTIPSGSPSAALTVSPIDDTLFEGNETVVVDLAPKASYALGTPSSATVTIADNDSSPSSVGLNFQPAGSPTYAGYLVDSGSVYGVRGNGYSYGWNAVAATRDRNNSLSPDQRYDTFAIMGNAVWEMALPNGTYTVRVVVGDSDWADVISKLTVEGVMAINGNTNSTTRWLEGTVTVTVNDGRLTVGNLSGSYNKICFIDISSSATNSSPSVSITSPANGASFAAPANITIAANASDSDGTVVKVEFFQGAVKLGEDLNGGDGWGFNWNSVPSGSYSLTARATDNGGTAATSTPVNITVNISSDTTPPVISSVSASGITNTSATVSWTTNESSGSQVDYGPTTQYGNSTTLNSTMVTSHSQALNGLTAGTTYNYRVKSADAAGNLAMSGNFVFTTTGTPPPSSVVNVNFQPAGSPTYPGYLVDSGSVYGSRGNGYSYGWNAVAETRDRNSSLSPDQRYDTFAIMGNAVWEIALPNGSYTVRVVVGDSDWADVVSKLTVEGVMAVNGNTNSTTRWREGTVTVTVNDGKLTVGNLAGSYNKICFIDISTQP